MSAIKIQIIHPAYGPPSSGRICLVERADMSGRVGGNVASSGGLALGRISGGSRGRPGIANYLLSLEEHSYPVEGNLRPLDCGCGWVRFCENALMAALHDLIADSWFPFAGEITVKPLEAPVVPEPPRYGVDRSECRSCQRSDDDCVWTNEHWRLTPYLPTQVRGIVLLETRDHHDSFADLPPSLLDQLGPMVARVERALIDLGDVARVHVNRWGDGGAHFHVWFMPRPLGRLQLRGFMLPMWLDVLPDVDETIALSAAREIARTLAESGGVAHV